MNRSTPHVPPILVRELSSHSPVHRASIVPDDEVADIVPLDHGPILILRGVVKQLLEERLGLLWLQALDVVDVHGQIQVHATGSLMLLYQLVATHGVVGRLDVGEMIRRSELLGMQNGVAGDVVLLQQLCLGFVVEVIPRRPGIAELGAATGAGGRKLVGQQERVASTAWIEARVDVEEAVAPVGLRPGAAGVDDGAVGLHVADIEQLVVLETILPACLVVGFDVVELAEFASQLNVGLVGQVCSAEDDHAVLDEYISGCVIEA